MADMDDYRKPGGSFDWKAYNAACVADGSHCRTCGRYMLPNIFKHTATGPRECGSCVSLREDLEEVTDDNKVRCPECRHTYDLTTYMSENAHYDGYQEGEHNVDCPQCEKTFTITTHVSYSFTSPALKEKPNESECGVECDSSTD